MGIFDISAGSFAIIKIRQNNSETQIFYCPELWFTPAVYLGTYGCNTKPKEIMRMVYYYYSFAKAFISIHYCREWDLIFN